MNKTQITKIREGQKITQAQLARRLGVARATVSIAEKKGIRNVAAAKRYATVLNCNPLDLIEL